MSNQLAEFKELAELVGEFGGERMRVTRSRGDGGIAETAYDDPPFPEEKRGGGEHSMWAIFGGVVFAPCEQAIGSLPPSQYTVEHSNQYGVMFRKTTINLDDLIDLPDHVSQDVIKDVEAFWKKEQHFREFGFLWKRGVLLWGPPGSGKTTTLQMISQKIINRGGISVYIDNPSIGSRALKVLRGIEPTRPLVVMLEDIDAIIDRHGESELLSMLDGELQVDNVVFVATTNYPEELDDRFVCRPSRFDIVRKVSMPSKQIRRAFLQAKNKRLAEPQAEKELEMWVEETEGFSIAHMKELIISVELFEIDFQSSIKRLKTLKSKPRSADGPFGFAGRENE